MITYMKYVYDLARIQTICMTILSTHEGSKSTRQGRLRICMYDYVHKICVSSNTNTDYMYDRY